MATKKTYGTVEVGDVILSSQGTPFFKVTQAPQAAKAAGYVVIRGEPLNNAAKITAPNGQISGHKKNELTVEDRRMSAPTEQDFINAACRYIAERATGSLSEAPDMKNWMLTVTKEGRDHHPFDVLQVAAALINGAALRIRADEPMIAEKLLALRATLDRIVDSY
jgi:hypothetical protein